MTAIVNAALGLRRLFLKYGHTPEEWKNRIVQTQEQQARLKAQIEAIPRWPGNLLRPASRQQAQQSLAAAKHILAKAQVPKKRTHHRH